MAKSIANLEQILPLNVLNVQSTIAALNHANKEEDEKKLAQCSVRLEHIVNKRKLDNFGILTDFRLSEDCKYTEIVNDNAEVRLSTDLKLLQTLKVITKVAEDNDLTIIIETAASGNWSNSKWFDTIAVTLV
jgi:hypothetical protein